MTTLLALVFVAFFAFVTILAIGLISITLPILFGGLYLALKKNKIDESRPSFLESFFGSPKLRSYFPLLLAPIIAALIYNSGLALPTNKAVLFITTPLGFIILGISLYKIFKGSGYATKTVSL